MDPKDEHAAGVGGTGEELQVTLNKIVSQLSIITGTLQVLEQRAITLDLEGVHARRTTILLGRDLP